MTIQSNPAVANLQSYASVAYADDHLKFERLHVSEWETANTGDKEKALIWASRLFNEYNFRGIKASVDQYLEWPRQYVVKEPMRSNEYYLDTELPAVLKDATAELAYHMLSEDRTLNSEENVGLSNMSVKGLSLTFNKDRTPTIPKYIRKLLTPIINVGFMLRG